MPKFIKKARQYAKGESPFSFFWRVIKYFVTHILDFKDRVTTEMIRNKLDKDLAIKEILGSQMYLNLREDTGVSYELYKAGIREKYIMGALLQEINEGDVIILTFVLSEPIPTKLNSAETFIFFGKPFTASSAFPSKITVSSLISLRFILCSER